MNNKVPISGGFYAIAEVDLNDEVNALIDFYKTQEEAEQDIFNLFDDYFAGEMDRDYDRDRIEEEHKYGGTYFSCQGCNFKYLLVSINTHRETEN